MGQLKVSVGWVGDNFFIYVVIIRWLVLVLVGENIC